MCVYCAYLDNATMEDVCEPGESSVRVVAIVEKPDLLYDDVFRVRANPFVVFERKLGKISCFVYCESGE